jgi:opacity protein-like surface antigen
MYGLVRALRKITLHLENLIIPAWLLFLLLVSIPPVQAEDAFQTDFTGYFDNLFILKDYYSHPTIEDRVQPTDMQRLRLMWEGSWERISFEAHYEHLMAVRRTAVEGIGTSGRIENVSAAFRYLDLDWNIETQEHFTWDHQFDRLNAKIDLGFANLTVGRQAISWGVGYLWSPVDLLTTFSPLQINRDYKAGVDAVLLDIPLGPFQEVYLAYAPEESWDNSGLLARHRLRLGAVDVAMTGGWIISDYVLGGEINADIKGMGMRMEVTHTWPEDTSRFVRALFGLDYQCTPALFLQLEYYYNGFGTSDPARYEDVSTTPRFLRGEIYNTAHHYLGVNGRYQFTPLIVLHGSTIINLNDGSVLLEPALIYSLSNNAEIRLGAIAALGKRPDDHLRSEFGAYPYLGFGELIFYFGR